MADENTNGPVKVTVNLSREAYDAVKKLAEDTGSTFTTALHKAISTEQFLRQKVQNDATILVQEKDKTLKEVVLR
jgi:hypothetical protein